MEKTSEDMNINLPSFLEHTLLRPDSSKEDIQLLCNEAIEYGMFGVCIPPYFVQHAAKALKQSEVKISTVVGFPFGYSVVAAKVEEAKKAIQDGAHEIDMVMNMGAFKSKDWSYLQNDIESVVTACHLHNRILKLIIETSFLNQEEIIQLTEICTKAEVNFVKTSTGYGSRGASVEDIVLLRKHLPVKTKIKASGGIKTRAFALELIAAGANRIGSSSCVKILKDE